MPCPVSRRAGNDEMILKTFKLRNRSKAEVYVLNGMPPLLVKDYGARGLFVRLFGGMSLRREAKMLERLAGVRGIPALCRRIGRCAIAMEYIDAPSLSEWKKTRDLPAGFAERLEQLFEAIESRGVFHGDPHFKNILCDRDGQPYLIDFSFSYLRGSWPILDGWIVRNLRVLRAMRLSKIRTVFYGEQDESRVPTTFTYRVSKWLKDLYRRHKKGRTED